MIKILSSERISHASSSRAVLARVQRCWILSSRRREGTVQSTGDYSRCVYRKSCILPNDLVPMHQLNGVRTLRCVAVLKTNFCHVAILMHGLSVFIDLACFEGHLSATYPTGVGGILWRYHERPPEQKFTDLHKRPTPKRGTAERCVKDPFSLPSVGAMADTI